MPATTGRHKTMPYLCHITTGQYERHPSQTPALPDKKTAKDPAEHCTAYPQIQQIRSHHANTTGTVLASRITKNCVQDTYSSVQKQRTEIARPT